MTRSILLFGLVCLQLCWLSALLQAQGEPPREKIINWCAPSWSSGTCRTVAVGYGKFYGIVEGGLVIGSVENGSYTVFTTADGLLRYDREPVREVHIDDSGFLWAYSDLAEYDPRLSWQVFDGVRWAGVGRNGQTNEGGCGVVDNRYGIWTRSTTKLVHYRLSPPGVAGSIEYNAGDFGVDAWPWFCGVDSSGCLWGTQSGDSGDSVSGIYSFDGLDLKRYDTPGGFTPWEGAVDRQDNKWFGGWTGQIARFDGESWEIWGAQDGLPSDKDWSWERFTFDEQCHPWVMGYYEEYGGIVDGCIIHFDGSRWQEVAPPGSGEFSLWEIASDENGRLFAFGSLAGTSAVFRLEGDIWQGPLTISGPVTSPWVSEVGIDRQDGVWFACNGLDEPPTRITHLGSEGYTSFDDFRDDDFWSVKVDAANNKWFGGSKLVVTQDMEHGYFACTPPEALSGIAFGPDGTVYVACIGKLYRIHDGEVTAEDLPWFNGQVWDVAVGPDGTVYLAFADVSDLESVRGGIYFNTGAGWKNLPVFPQWSLPANMLSCPVLGLQIDGLGRIWALVWGCLAMFDGSQWTAIEYDGHSVFGTPSPQPSLTLDSHGNLWFFGTVTWGNNQQSAGLCRFDGANFTVWTQQDGILPDLHEYGQPSETVGAISEDQYGNMWAAGNGISLLLAGESLVLTPSADEATSQGDSRLTLSTAFQYMAPSANADLYVAIQAPSGQIFYVAPQGAEPAFPIFYAAFDGSTEFLKPGPDYTGPGSMPNTPDMKDFAAPALPLPDPPDGQGPTGLALFAYPVPYFANVPLPAYSAIEDFVLLNTTLPENAPTGAYTFHIGITAPSSISNVYRTASATFEVSAD